MFEALSRRPFACYPWVVPKQDSQPLDPLYLFVGKRVAQLRRTRVRPILTQRELAEKIGLTRASIANIEAGRQRLSLEVIWRIGLAFDLDPGQLLPSREEFENWLNPDRGRGTADLDRAVVRELESMGLRGSAVEAWIEAKWPQHHRRKEAKSGNP